MSTGRTLRPGQLAPLAEPESLAMVYHRGSLSTSIGIVPSTEGLAVHCRALTDTMRPHEARMVAAALVAAADVAERSPRGADV